MLFRYILFAIFWTFPDAVSIGTNIRELAEVYRNRKWKFLVSFRLYSSFKTLLLATDQVSMPYSGYLFTATDAEKLESGNVQISGGHRSNLRRNYYCVMKINKSFSCLISCSALITCFQQVMRNKKQSILFAVSFSIGKFALWDKTLLWNVYTVAYLGAK